jgi:adhesin/invasin
VQTNTAGTADFSDLVIIDVGQYNLVFAEPGGKTATSNAFDIVAAGADAGQTTASVPNGSAGDKTNITITVNDAFGNIVTGAVGDLAVTISGENPGATFDGIEGIGDGTYTTGYTPTSTGDDIITITLDGAGIQGSPFTSTVITSDAAFVEVATQPLQTVAGQPVAGSPTALVTDGLTNGVSGIDVVAGLSSGSFASGTITVSSDGSGQSVFDDLVITQAGSYTINFNAQGVTDAATTTSFDVISAAASNLVIDSGNNQTATVTNTLANPLTVQVTDEFGNPVEGESISFAITDVPSGATGQSLSATTVLTGADGLASTTLTTGNISGDYSVTASGTGIGPVVFTATANAGAASIFSFDTITSPQTAGSGFTISLTAQDSEGNTSVNYSGTATLSTTAGTITPSTIGFTSGTASVNVTVSNAGTGQIITAEDGSITGSSNTFDVQSGGIDAANSSVTASPLTLQAGQTSTLTVELRDGSNNLVGDLIDADFTITPSGNATVGTVSETTEGIYTADITNETAETVTVTVTVSGTQLNDIPEIEFTAGSLSVFTLFSGDNQTGTVAQQLPADFIVEAEDTFGNPVSGVQVNFALDQVPSGATGQSLNNTQIQTGSLGRASTRLTLGNLPGTYTVDASATGVGTITFTSQAEIGEASAMTVTTQPGETTAGNAISPSPAVTITDDAGNAIEGVNVSVSEQGGYTFDSETLEVLTNADGVATFSDLVINTANNYTIVFDADAPAVSDLSSDAFDIVAAAGDPLNSTATVPDGAAGDPTTITITVWDQFNNAVTGAEPSVSITTGPNPKTDFVITDVGDGTYTTSYTPQATGTDQIDIALSGTPISGSPYSSEVTTSDVDASNSNVTATPETLQAGNNSLVSVEVRDGSNNPVSGLGSGDFSISVSGDGSAGPISETGTGGTYQFNVSNTTAEQVTVAVTATGTTLLDSPTITFTAADPDLLFITQQPLLSEAGQPIAGPPAARVTDEFGNRVPDVEVAISEQGGEPFAIGSTSTLNTNSLGLAIFDNIAIEQAGDYNLVFSVTGITNRTSNLFEVTESDPSAAQTTASVPNGSAGVRTQISITVRDAFGNRVEGASASIGVGISGENDSSSLEGITEIGDGAYSTGYTPQNNGTDQVAIDIGGVAIPNSPFASEVSPSDAENVAMQQQPLETVAGNAVEGSPSVLVTDGFDNPVEGVEVNVSLNGGLFEVGSTTTIVTESSGIAEFSNLLIESSDSYTLEFNAVGVTENAVSSTFDVVADVANSIELASGNNQTGSVTEQLGNPLAVRVIDQFDNPVSGETIGFEITAIPVEATGQTLSLLTADTGIEGLSATELTLGNRTGAYEVTATLAGIGTVVFSASAVAGDAVGLQFDAITSPQSVDSPFSISITALDSEGNTAESYQGTANLSTTAGTINPTTADFSNGTVTLEVEVSSEVTGATITATDDAITGTSGTFDVEALAPSQMSITGQPTESVAGEIITPSPAIQLLDGDSNPISGVDITATLSSNSFSGTSTAIVSTDASGNAVFDNLVIETATDGYTITFDADLVDVGNVTSSLFDVTAATASAIEQVSGGGQTGEVNTQLANPFVVRVVDDFGNLISGEDVAFAIVTDPDGATGQELTNLTATSNANGEAQSTLTLGSAAGTYTVESSFDGVVITFTADATTP